MVDTTTSISAAATAPNSHMVLLLENGTTRSRVSLTALALPLGDAVGERVATLRRRRDLTQREFFLTLLLYCRFARGHRMRPRVIHPPGDREHRRRLRFSTLPLGSLLKCRLTPTLGRPQPLNARAQLA